MTIEACVFVIKLINSILIQCFYIKASTAHKELSFMLNSFISVVNNKFSSLNVIINKIEGYKSLSLYKEKRVFNNDDIIAEKIK